MQKATLDFNVIFNVLRDVELEYLDFEDTELTVHNVFDRVLDLALDYNLENFSQLSNNILCFGNDRFKHAVDSFFLNAIRSGLFLDNGINVDNDVKEIVKSFENGFKQGAVLLVVYQNDLVGILVAKSKSISDKALLDFYRFKMALMDPRLTVSDGVGMKEEIH